MPESAYDRERRRTCEWCAKGLARITEFGALRFADGQPRHPSQGSGPMPFCTAPTIEVFAEKMAAEASEAREECRTWHYAANIYQEDRSRARTAFDHVHNAAGLGVPSWLPGQSVMKNADAVCVEIAELRKDKERLKWLINELNELYSNCTRDVFGWAGDEEGDISVEAIDAAMKGEV